MSKTDNYRIYAIGDIHGCLDPLQEIQARILADLQANPHDKPLVVYLGDYMDRGPENRAVIDNLIAAKSASLPARFLLGNHDRFISLFLESPTSLHKRSIHWLNPGTGGEKTLESYGVMNATEADAEVMRDLFEAAIPDAHRSFLNECEFSIHIGGYFFAHAGVRPGIRLHDQEFYDLIWIREPFLSSNQDFGAIVVHGHSPVKKVENHGNRIAVDTGAVFGGTLSCLVLEGDNQWVLHASGRAECPVIA
ncbi:MAG: serine/threonine protein phosphatase [Rhodobacteraceae bacterium]|nr:serine/threonine protein phosphatase [Paracoccaceae bacterium]